MIPYHYDTILVEDLGMGAAQWSYFKFLQKISEEREKRVYTACQ